MTGAIVFALLAQGASAPQAGPPLLAAGVTPEFAKAAMNVEASLVAGDLPAARRALAELPVSNAKLAWANPETLPPLLREKLADSLQVSATSWSRFIRGFSVQATTAGGADMTIGFTDLLPDGPESLPIPTRIDGRGPFRATIGLGRGKPPRSITLPQLNVEIAYAIGRYLGVGDNPFPGTAMFRNPNPIGASFWPGAQEAQLAARNLQLAERLRAAVEAGKPTGLVAGGLEMEKPSLELGEVRQGDVIRTEIIVTNTGTGPLQYQIKPDCSCFEVPIPGVVAPHQKMRLPIRVDTSAYMGKHDKRLLLLTNDPLKSRVEIPVSFLARPAYRVFRPLGENFVVPAAGGGFDVYLFAGPGETFKPKTARLKDVDGKVTWAEWSGPLADGDMNEGALPRKGWRFRIQLPPGLPSGRANASLEIDTDSKLMGTIQYAFTTQKGIVPLGGTTYFPNVIKGAVTSFLISRPNQPFKIKSIDAGPFKAAWRDNRGGWEYEIELEYHGGAAPGEFLTPIRIHTDDPQQPLVEALVSGTVK